MVRLTTLLEHCYTSGLFYFPRPQQLAIGVLNWKSSSRENNTNKAFYHIETDQETSFADPETFELISKIKTTGNPAVLRIENEVLGNIAYEILNRILTRYNFSKLDIGVAYVSHQTIQINEISRRAIG